MNLCRCENGHFYDKEKYASCPHCTGGSAADSGLTEAFTNDVTQPLTQPGMPGFIPRENDTEQYDPMDLPLSDKSADEKTEAVYQPFEETPTVPLTIPLTVPIGMEDDDYTVGIYDDFFQPSPAKNTGQAIPARMPEPMSAAGKAAAPCVGWLIALGGEHVGTDFRLKAGKNFIGRSSRMDVALTEDKSVSRDRHAIVVYEPKAHLYLVQPGESSSLVYKNDEVVLTPMQLEPYDLVTVGDVDLLFMPLCGTRFNWGDHFKKMKHEE